MSNELSDAARRAQHYLENVGKRRVAPDSISIRALDELSGPLPETGEEAELVIADLDRLGSPATVASAGGRYFGFVVGSGLPVALAANWLAGSWNQNVAMEVMSPVGSRLERVALGWIRDVLALPSESQGAFVTGDTLANFTALAAARHEVLRKVGHDVESQGMSRAPSVTVLVGNEVHVSVLRAISLLGLGRDRVVRLPVDEQGRMQVDQLPSVSGPTIVCTQVGNVNTGTSDPVREISRRVHPSGAWVHVDGAFGLWARVSPGRRAQIDGVEEADSWALDCHKWLNVPYDSGAVFVRNSDALRAAMAAGPAAYLPSGGEGDRMEFTPEMSRRARGVDVWAALRYLGRSGLADLVERCCGHARLFADRLTAAGFHVLNDVELNQVLVSFGSDAVTRAVISAIQQEGTCWCGGTVWHGTTAMRISVSSWATTETDVERSVEAMIRVAKELVPD